MCRLLVTIQGYIVKSVIKETEFLLLPNNFLMVFEIWNQVNGMGSLEKAFKEHFRGQLPYPVCYNLEHIIYDVKIVDL